MSLFSVAQHRFHLLSDGDQIETNSFLLACSEIVPFFDKLGSTAFSPVKSDINGNIQRLRTKYETDHDKYSTLQSIVDSEIDEGVHIGKYSCTLGLLWLKRALEFIYVFLDTVVSGEHDLVKCANIAYESSLRKYHGWIVKGIFTIAVRAVPYYDPFIQSLKVDTSLRNEEVLEHIQSSLEQLKTNIDEINKFYSIRELRFDGSV